MGFLDKLRDIALGKSHPLADETVKKHYEIAYGLFASMKGDYVDFDATKIYIEHCTGEECDVEKLQKALTYYGEGPLYKILTKEYELRSAIKGSVPPSDIEKILKVNNELAQSSNYRCTKEEAIEICFKQYREDVRTRFCEMLDVLKEQPKKKFLDEGITKLDREFNLPPNCDPERAIARKVIADVMVERLLAEDPTVRTLVVEEVCEYGCKKKTLPLAYAIALRAVQFEKYGKNLEKYQTITEEDCHNAAMNSPIYQEKSREESPFEKGSVYNKAAKNIMKCKIMDWQYDSDWKTWAAKDIRFTDAACYYALQEMATYYVDSDTKDVEKAVDLVAAYVTSAD